MMRAKAVAILMFLVLSGVFANPLSSEQTTQNVEINNKPEELPAASPSVQPPTENAPQEFVTPLPSESQPKEPAQPEQSNRQSRQLNNEINTVSHKEDALIRKLNVQCSQKEVSSCMMLKLITYVNRLLKKADIEVSDSIEITQTSQVIEEDARSEETPRSDQSDESMLSDLLSDKLWNFVKTRSLKWKVIPDADITLSTAPNDEGTLNLGMSIRTGKSVEEGRGKNKNMSGILAAAIMKIGLLGGLAFKALVLLVGKAIIVSKIALLLAVILWLKKLFSQEKHVTYEVVAHPHHSHHDGHHDSYSSGWGRSYPGVQSGDPQNLAYSAHVPSR